MSCHRYLAFSISMLFVFLCPWVQAQAPKDIRFEHPFSSDSPLTVAFIQDSDGFFWLGTQNGLIRYDGYDLKIYRTGPNSISNDLVVALVEDRNGAIWNKDLEEFNYTKHHTESRMTSRRMQLKFAEIAARYYLHPERMMRAVVGGTPTRRKIFWLTYENIALSAFYLGLRKLGLRIPAISSVVRHLLGKMLSEPQLFWIHAHLNKKPLCKGYEVPEYLLFNNSLGHGLTYGDLVLLSQIRKKGKLFVFYLLEFRPLIVLGSDEDLCLCHV